jgi:hypothetical protein
MVRRVEPDLVPRDLVDAISVVGNTAPFAVGLRRFCARHEPTVHGEACLCKTNNIAIRREDQFADWSCRTWAAASPEIVPLTSEERNALRQANEHG